MTISIQLATFRIPASGQVRGIPASGQVRRIPASGQVRGIPASGQVRGIPASEQVRGISSEPFEHICSGIGLSRAVQMTQISQLGV